MNDKCEYCQIAGGYGELIKETSYWMIFLAPSQRYLGTCVVALKRRCQNLSEVQDEEWKDFVQLVRKIENGIKKAFKPTLFNWSCFNNMAFREEDPNPEIHWHFIPRYQEDVNFSGLEFHDPEFGYIPQPIKIELPPEIMAKIKQEIEQYL